MRHALFKRLDSRLLGVVGIVLLVFAVLAGFITYTLAYRHQFALAESLQRQLVDTVKVQAEVAAFAANAQIAQGVLSGLIANPVILAARIESNSGFSADLGYREKGSPGLGKAYPLLSPVDHVEQIGTLIVVQNDDWVQGSAVQAAVLPTLLMLLQILIAVLIMAVVLRTLMIRPITRLSKAIAAIQPGSSLRLEVDSNHAMDEIGLLSNSANMLLETAERSIKEERALRNLLEVTGGIAKVGGWTLDADTWALRWTEELYRFAGLGTTDSLTPEQAREILDLPERSILIAAVRDCIERGGAFDVELPITTSAEKQKWARWQGVAEQIDGKTVRLYGACQDITERKQVEADLILAKQAAENASITKSRFLAAASHDLRQPMQAISLFNEALARTSLNLEQKRISGYLAQSIQSLGELLNALLDISKLDGGVIKADPEVVQVGVLVQKINAEFSLMAAAKSLRFKLHFPVREMAIMTDGTLLMSLLGNLIGNAIKYTRQGGVLVGIRRRGNQTLIQVWDTGIGIAPEYMNMIFEEYFQISNSERDMKNGLGLGLAIAKRLAILLETEIVCRSWPEKGSVFEFLLPLADSDVESKEETIQAESAVTSAITATRLSGRRVVVVEDDVMVARAIRLSLESFGVNVTHYGSTEAALVDPDIASADFYISDYMLSGLHGVQFLDAIQQRSTKPIKGLLLTGDTSRDRIEAAQSSGWPVLFKPVDLPKLLLAIDALMEGSIQKAPAARAG